MEILVINPGSTSTKIAIYQDENPIYTESISHTPADLAPFPGVLDQLEYRLAMIRAALDKAVQEGLIQQKPLHLLTGQHLHLPGFLGRQLAADGGILLNQPLLHRLVQCGSTGGVAATHSPVG